MNGSSSSILPCKNAAEDSTCQHHHPVLRSTSKRERPCRSHVHERAHARTVISSEMVAVGAADALLGFAAAGFVLCSVGLGLCCRICAALYRCLPASGDVDAHEHTLARRDAPAFVAVECSVAVATLAALSLHICRD